MELADKKIFATLFFSIFTSVTGVGIVVPLLPVYAHDLGASGIYIGLIFGAFAFSRTFFLPYFGRCSDRRGRKPYIVTGLFSYALISFAFIAATRVEILIAIRFIQGIASAMIMPVSQAYVGDITPKNREGFTMGMFNMSIFTGLSIGPLIGGMLNDRFSLNAAFVTMGFLSFISCMLALVLLPPSRFERVTMHRQAFVPWKTLMRDPVVDGIFFYRFAYTACIGTIWGFLPVFADAGFSLSSSAIGFLVMLGIMTSGLLQTPMGYLSDRANKRLMILLGGLVVIFAMISFSWARSVADLCIANIIFGIGGSLSMAPLMAIAVQKGVEKKAMGAVMALLTMGHSLGMMTGAFLAGMLMDMVALRQTFFWSSLVMCAGVTIFFFCTLSGVQKNEVAEKEAV